MILQVSTDSSSLSEAAEEYDVVETVESLRSLAVEIRKAGTSVQELMEFSNMLRRIQLDRLEEYIKARESFGDKAHVEAKPDDPAKAIFVSS